MLYQFIRQDTLKETSSVSQDNEHQVLPYRWKQDAGINMSGSEQ